MPLIFNRIHLWVQSHRPTSRFGKHFVAQKIRGWLGSLAIFPVAIFPATIFPATLLVTTALLLSLSTPIYGQDTEPPVTTPRLLHVTAYDDSQFPTIQLDVLVRPADGDQEVEDTPLVSFSVEEDGIISPVTESLSQQATLDVAMLIDPVYLEERGYSGQTYHGDIVLALYDMVGQEMFLREQDRLAIFTMLPNGNQQAIQPWTTEPNLIYNSFVQEPPISLDADLLPTDAWLNVLAQYERGLSTFQPQNPAADLPQVEPTQSLVLFMVGSQIVPPEFVSTALEARIQLHIVDLAYTQRDSDTVSALTDLTTESGGRYLAYQDVGTLTELYQTLMQDRTVHQLRFTSSRSTAGPITVRATLADGTIVQQTVDPPLSSDGSDLLNQPRQSAARQSATEQSATEQSEEAAASSSELGANPEPTTVPLEEPASGEVSSGEVSSEEVAQVNGGADGQIASVQEAALQQPVALSADEAAVQSEPAQDASTQDASTQDASTQGAGSGTAASMITIPFLDVAVPKLALQLALPLLVVLIGYVLYTERKSRTLVEDGNTSNAFQQHPAQHHPAQHHPAQHHPGQGFPLRDPTPTAISVTDPYANFQPLSKSPAEPSLGAKTQGMDPTGAGNSALNSDEPASTEYIGGASAVTGAAWLSGSNSGQFPEGQPPETQPPLSVSNSVFINNHVDGANDNDTTSALPEFGDDDVTYRLTDEIQVPLLGQLMRVTSDPSLPQALPIHRLDYGPGEQRRLYIGRHSQKNTIVINDKRISREHAVVVQKEGQLYLQDNGSSSGTFLNWKRLRAGEELVLRHCDLISLGDIVYEFRLRGEDEATVAHG